MGIKHSRPVPPFMRYCSAIIPTMFDDSLSYYEALCALNRFIQKNLVEVINNNATVTQEYIELTNQLKEYMENYFDNLDVQEEINNKLDSMVEDGSLIAIIKPYIDATYADYKRDIDAIVDSQNVKINALTDYTPEAVSSTSEMTDHDKIYVNTTDGYWYYWSGSAFVQGGVFQGVAIVEDNPVIIDLEGRISDLRTTTENLLDNEKLKIGYIIDSEGLVVSDPSGGYYDQLIPVQENDYISMRWISSTTFATRRIYYFDADEQLVDRPTVDATTPAYKKIPSGVAFVSFQIYKDDIKVQLTKTGVQVDYTEHFTANDKLARKITSQADSLNYNLLDPSQRRVGKILNNLGNEVDDAHGVYYKMYIDSSVNKTFTLQLTHDNDAGKIRRVYTFDENRDIIDRPQITKNIPFTVDDSVKYITIQVHDGDTNLMLTTGSDFKPYLPYGYTSVDSELRAIVSKDYGTCPAIKKIYDVWEPATATDAYECPLGYDNANLDMSYQTLLSTYFDNHLGKYSDGYSVRKFTLGQDSAKSYYEMFYYEFAPKYYNKTVLISAGMNTSELAPIFGLGYFVNALMNSTDEGIKMLRNSTRFVVLPAICPSSFQDNPKKYLNYNGVRINKNFNYIDSWDHVSTDGRGTKGAYPDSEAETQHLKEWINKYEGADLWIDCHADLDGNYQRLFDTICSSQSVINKILPAQTKMQDFYYDKGYFNDPSTLQNRNRVEGGTQYPKTLYSANVMGIPAIMVEQFARCTAYGASGTKQCEPNSIKNYATMLSQYCMAMLID